MQLLRQKGGWNLELRGRSAIGMPTAFRNCPIWPKKMIFDRSRDARNLVPFGHKKSQKVTKSHKKSRKKRLLYFLNFFYPISSTGAVLELLWCLLLRHICEFAIFIPNICEILTFLSSTWKFCNFFWKTDQYCTAFLRQKEVSAGTSRGRSAIGMATAFRNTPIWPPKTVPTACQSRTKGGGKSGPEKNVKMAKNQLSKWKIKILSPLSFDQL